ncbi:MAG TPA: hypothetical protein DCL86_11770 [Bacteroidales bacterium]|nr:hypothetical protein [Bacteroidales bacterium]
MYIKLSGIFTRHLISQDYKFQATPDMKNKKNAAQAQSFKQCISIIKARLISDFIGDNKIFQ